MDHQDKIAALDKAIEDCVSTMRQVYGDTEGQELTEQEWERLSGRSEINARLTRIMDKVFEWRDELIKTKTFKRALDCQGPEFIVFQGRFGHGSPDLVSRPNREVVDVNMPYCIKSEEIRNMRCDSVVFIDRQGSLRYRCWDEFSYWSVELVDAKMAAHFLADDFIEALYAQVFSGAVYDVMKKDVEQYQEAIISVEEMKKEGYLDHIF